MADRIRESAWAYQVTAWPEWLENDPDAGADAAMLSISVERQGPGDTWALFRGRGEGRRPELRLLADTGGGLAPASIHLDQPTLAWSASAVAGVMAAGAPAGVADMAAQAGRLLAWWVWPLLGALLDEDTCLTRTAVLGDDADPNVRGAQVYQATWTPPRHLHPA